MKKIIKKAYKLLTGFYSVENWWRIRNNLKAKQGFYYYNLFKYIKILKKYGSDIPLDCKMGNCPIFPHEFYGVFISKGAIIGKDCVIYQHVTIGSNTLSDSPKKGSPVIGDNCYIGCGAKIIGNVRIGNNVRIGANCIVVDDVPDNCTVVLPKSRVIQKTGNQDNNFVLIDDLRRQ